MHLLDHRNTEQNSDCGTSMYPDKHDMIRTFKTQQQTYRLIWDTELVLERIVWYDRTLIYEGAAIVSIIAEHVNTVPMLHVDINKVA